MENEGTLSKFSGDRKRKSGKYVAEKWDPIKEKGVWLGTFNTAEEASNANLTKQREFVQLNQGGSESPDYAHHMFVEMPSSNLTKKSGAARRSKADHGKMPFIKEISFRDKSPLLWHNMGKKKQVCKANMHEFEKLVKVNQGKEPLICVESCKQTSCNTVTRKPKSKTGLLGIRKQKNGRYGAEIRDPIKHKQVWLGTFGTVEEAKQAYLSKKSEFDMLIEGNNKENTTNCDQTLHAAGVGRNKKVDSPKTTRIVGVNKNKWGKYTSEIIDPIIEKKIWLGTFDTYEEASQAYQSKKLEFQKLVKPKKKCNKKRHSTARDQKQVGKEKLVNAEQGHVNREGFQPHSAGGSSSLEFDVPISNSSNGGSDQKIDSHEISHSTGVQKRNNLMGTSLGIAEETFHAYQYMKFVVQSSKKAELQSSMPIDFSTGKKKGGQEEDADLWMGQWVQLPGGKEVNFSLKLGLPIIDNYGSLLGEFSCLDNPQYILDGGCDDE